VMGRENEVDISSKGPDVQRPTGRDDFDTQ